MAVVKTAKPRLVNKTCIFALLEKKSRKFAKVKCPAASVKA